MDQRSDGEEVEAGKGLILWRVNGIMSIRVVGVGMAARAGTGSFFRRQLLGALLACLQGRIGCSKNWGDLDSSTN